MMQDFTVSGVWMEPCLSVINSILQLKTLSLRVAQENLFSVGALVMRIM